MAYKKFAQAVALLIGINLLIKLIWIFFIERNVQLNVGFEAFGLYYSIFNFTLILGVINDPGINNYLINYVSKENHTGQQMSEVFYFKLLLSGVYLVVGVVISYLIGFKDDKLLFLLLIYQLLFSFLGYLRSFLKAYQLLNTEVLFSVIDKGMLIPVFLPLLYFQNSFTWTIHFYVLCQIVALLLSIVFCGYFLNKKRIRIFFTGHISFNPNILKKIFPFATFAFLVLAYNKVDAVMLEQMLPNGAMQTGIYVAAYRFLDAASMLPILFASLFYPIMCKVLTNRQKVDKLVKGSLSFLLGFAIITAASSWFYREQIMDLLYRESATQQLNLVFGVLMWSLPLVVIYYVFSSVFTANSNLKILNIVSVMGLVINIILNILLIPNFHALGAAISSFTSFFIIGLAYLILYHVHFKCQVDWLLWFKLLLFIALLVGLGDLSTHVALAWMLKLTAYVIFATILAVIFKFFDIKTIKMLLK